MDTIFKIIGLILAGLFALGFGTCSFFGASILLSSPKTLLSSSGLIMGALVLICACITWFSILACIKISSSIGSEDIEDNKEKEKP